MIKIRGMAVCAVGVMSALAVVAASEAYTMTSTPNHQEAGAPPIFKPGAPGQASQTITPEQSVELGSSRYTMADVRFMQMMAVHHAQAVEMVALIEDRTTHEGIISIGGRIAASQKAEIAMMHKWLRDRGQPIMAPEGHQHGGHQRNHQASHQGDKHNEHKNTKEHSGHQMTLDDPDVPMMSGMLSLNQMKALAASKGVAFDRLFLTGMILHHQGALDMVDTLNQEPGSGEDPFISEFLASIVADQSSEIIRMQAMLAALPEQAL